MTTTTLPMTIAGAAPIPATQLLSDVITSVQAQSPGYTSNLPGILIEDISSTVTAALAQIDQSRVDAVNSNNPASANPYVLAQLGSLLGIPQGQPTNTSCYVVFTGQAGYYIPIGFLVSDGTNIYAVQDGGTIQTNGASQPLYVVAVNPGSWAVPVGTITLISTSVASPYTLSVTNQVTGVAGGPAESVQSYRSRLMEAQISAAQGTPEFIKTQLRKINGVNSRLVSVLQVSGGWEIICGGGDPYAVAGAIYSAVLDLSAIVGSATTARNITTSVIDAPNIYNVISVNPPAQTVGVAVTWNTTLPNFQAGVQVNQTGQTAILNYINSIVVGSPLNLLAMDGIFQNAVASIVPIIYLTTLTYVVTVNGTIVTPSAGTSLIATDPESYFEATDAGITVTQG